MRLLALLVFLLAGCTQAEDAATLAEEKTKRAKDIEAGILENAPCLIGLGAWDRMPDLQRRKAVFLLCVNDAGQFGIKLESP